MNWKRILLSLILIILIFYIYNYVQISKFYINKLKLTTNKLTGSIRLTQISDFHSNEKIDLEKLSIREFKPDIIFLTGDIIDHKTRDMTLAFKMFEGITDISPNVYFVSGNHELLNSSSKKFYEGLKEYGIRILDNKSEIIELNGQKINLFGASFYAEKEDYDVLFKDIDNKKYNILLSHSPNRPIMYLNERVDLILSGHTHGGQVRLPIIGGIIAPGQGFFPKYDKGTFELGNTILYIDSGIGNSVYPIRAFNRVQYTNIVIEGK